MQRQEMSKQNVNSHINILHAKHINADEIKQLKGKFVSDEIANACYIVPTTESIQIYVSGKLVIYKKASDPIADKILKLWETPNHEGRRFSDTLTDTPREGYRHLGVDQPLTQRTTIGYLGHFAPTQEEIMQGQTGFVTHATTELHSDILTVIHESAQQAETFIAANTPQIHANLMSQAKSKIGILSNLNYMSTITFNRNFPSKFHTDNNGTSSNDSPSWNYMVVYQHEGITGGDLIFPELEVTVKDITYQGVCLKLATGNSTVFDGTTFMHGNKTILYKKPQASIDEMQVEIEKDTSPVERKSFVFYSKGSLTESLTMDEPKVVINAEDVITISNASVKSTYKNSRAKRKESQYHPNILAFNAPVLLKLDIQLGEEKEYDSSSEEFRMGLLKTLLNHLVLKKGEDIIQSGIPRNQDFTLSKHLYLFPGLEKQAMGVYGKLFFMKDILKIIPKGKCIFSVQLKLLPRENFENAMKLAIEENKPLDSIVPYSLHFNNKQIINFYYACDGGDWQLINNNVKEFEKLLKKNQNENIKLKPNSSRKRAADQQESLPEPKKIKVKSTNADFVGRDVRLFSGNHKLNIHIHFESSMDESNKQKRNRAGTA